MICETIIDSVIDKESAYESMKEEHGWEFSFEIFNLKYVQLLELIEMEMQKLYQLVSFDITEKKKKISLAGISLSIPQRFVRKVELILSFLAGRQKLILLVILLQESTLVSMLLFQLQ